MNEEKCTQDIIESDGGSVQFPVISQKKYSAFDLLDIGLPAFDISKLYLASRGGLNVKYNVSDSSKEEHVGRIDLAKLPKVYPHVYEKSGEYGDFNVHIDNALLKSRKALQDYQGGDISSVMTALTQVAAALAAAYAYTQFNSALGGVVSFLKRAVLVVGFDDVNMQLLNSIVSAINSIQENPLIDFDDAADMVDELEGAGLNGAHKTIENLLMFFVEEKEDSLSKDIVQAFE